MRLVQYVYTAELGTRGVIFPISDVVRQKYDLQPRPCGTQILLRVVVGLGRIPVQPVPRYVVEWTKQSKNQKECWCRHQLRLLLFSLFYEFESLYGI